jgi:hypothetical protein
LDEPYSASIATNVSDADLALGDVLTFAKLSGPAWLNVAANGMLSGTPEDIYAGTNSFEVSVTNLGGGSNTATMIIYVDSTPEWKVQNFTTPNATVGIPYLGTIATNATDVSIAAGDTLTFYKVAGPAWLQVAANGQLSGVPSSTNLGPNTFLVLVVDAGELSAVTDLRVTVVADVAPAFVNNPFTAPAATVGQSYAASIAADASDSAIGDVLTFSEISGPAWLTVGTNGILSGTPLAANLGTNIYVVSVADLGGLSNSATMYVNVVVPSFVANLAAQGSNLMLTWSGGNGPYQIQLTTDLSSGVWQNVGAPTNATSIVLSPSNVTSFYRVHGQ